MQYKVARWHEHHEWVRPSRLWATKGIGHVGYLQDGLGEMYSTSVGIQGWLGPSEMHHVY